MSRSRDERLLAFLEGELGEAERETLLDEVLADPDLARELRQAAAGLGAMREVHGDSLVMDVDDTRGSRVRRRVSPWWTVGAAAAAVIVTVPATWFLASQTGSSSLAVSIEPASRGQPVSPDPSFLLVLQGRWPDLGQLAPEEAQRRGQEYWAWTTSLSERGILMAAGDLRWEPGQQVMAGGGGVQVAASYLDRPEYVVGVFAIRASTYEEAMAIARDCPHLDYGGTVSVRRVGTGFVTAAGFGDWE
ncbi:MAG: hypothetical protein HKO53_13235 [Gemmatimonadetes bacterium]|nr:hypothetical protein [Gemmatimonadota bacterium]